MPRRRGRDNGTPRLEANWMRGKRSRRYFEQWRRRCDIKKEAHVHRPQPQETVLLTWPSNKSERALCEILTPARRPTPYGWPVWRHHSRRRTATSWDRARRRARYPSARRSACPRWNRSPDAPSWNTVKRRTVIRNHYLFCFYWHWFMATRFQNTACMYIDRYIGCRYWFTSYPWCHHFNVWRQVNPLTLALPIFLFSFLPCADLVDTKVHLKGQSQLSISLELR